MAKCCDQVNHVSELCFSFNCVITAGWLNLVPGKEALHSLFPALQFRGVRPLAIRIWNEFPVHTTKAS